MKSQKGMILITALMLLSILTQLILSLMQSVFLYSKLTTQREQSHQVIYDLEQMARKLIVSVNADCQIKSTTAQAMNYLQHNQGCLRFEKNREYRYVVNDLGSYICLPILFKGQEYTSHHLLLNILDTAKPQMILQIRYAVRENSSNCHENNKRIIHSGLVSWQLKEVPVPNIKFFTH